MLVKSFVVTTKDDSDPMRSLSDAERMQKLDDAVAQLGEINIHSVVDTHFSNSSTIRVVVYTPVAA